MKESTNKKIRLDNLILEKGLSESRNKAQALIMSGKVKVSGKTIDKSGTLVNINSELTIIENNKYVSRGGDKLEKALLYFNIDVENKSALDIGASTGGFTDCLLKHGARKVYAYDVGYGQLDWKLRNDNRVIVKEKINCRNLKFEDVGEKVDIVTIDVSFISLDKIIPPAINILIKNGVLIVLIKPQFEVGKGEVEKGGVIRDLNKHIKVKSNITQLLNGLDINVLGVIDSPLLGKSGNQEYLMCGIT